MDLIKFIVDYWVCLLIYSSEKLGRFQIASVQRPEIVTHIHIDFVVVDSEPELRIPENEIKLIVLS
mgnify:FL=1